MNCKTHLTSSKILLVAITILLFNGCQKNEQSVRLDDTIFQVSTIDALLAGDFYGRMSFSALQDRGDFGVGTFEGVDGEMVMLEGVAYQIRTDLTNLECKPFQ